MIERTPINFTISPDYDTLQTFLGQITQGKFGGDFNFFFVRSTEDYDLDFNFLSDLTIFNFFKTCFQSMIETKSNYCGITDNLTYLKYQDYFKADLNTDGTYSLYANEVLLDLFNYLFGYFMDFIKNKFIGVDALSTYFEDRGKTSLREYWFIYSYFKNTDLYPHSPFASCIFKYGYYSDKVLPEVDAFIFKSFKYMSRQKEYYKMLSSPPEAYYINLGGKYFITPEFLNLINKEDYWRIYKEFKKMPPTFYATMADYSRLFS